MIIVRRGKNVSRQYPDHLLPAVCLDLAGGGFTTRQTSIALATEHQLRQTGTAHLKGCVITLKPD